MCHKMIYTSARLKWQTLRNVRLRDISSSSFSVLDSCMSPGCCGCGCSSPSLVVSSWYCFCTVSRLPTVRWHASSTSLTSVSAPLTNCWWLRLFGVTDGWDFRLDIDCVRVCRKSSSAEVSEWMRTKLPSSAIQKKYNNLMKKRPSFSSYMYRNVNGTDSINWPHWELSQSTYTYKDLEFEHFQATSLVRKIYISVTYFNCDQVPAPFYDLDRILVNCAVQHFCMLVTSLCRSARPCWILSRLDWV